MSRRAPSSVSAVAYLNVSPVRGCSVGSKHMSWQTSVMTFVVKSLSSLCLSLTPFELRRDCQRLVYVWQPPFKLRSDGRVYGRYSEMTVAL